MLSQQHDDQGQNGAGGRNGGDGEGSEGRGGNNNKGETEQRRFEPTRKLDIPIFSGDDANGWLEDLLKRFQPGAALNLMAPLLEVKQVEDVAQYRREFEATAQTQKNLGTEALMCIFANGLKKEIQVELEVARFDYLPALMDRATAIEWRNQAWKETRVDPNGRRVEGLTKGSGSGGSGSVGARFGFFKNSSPAKYNSHDSRGEEWAERQRKGLC
ncbi:hypothetical protein Ahy_A07g033898 [Arachis hypogaea]|uniref:Retrotransposon gag domain-containing protein n=1 Tax=Arachis hypogaea TaxID=3818 RepID=A0A445CAD3_ARAHY|nr:hypothetical protein Ahy_A07g033898 [Arachis hypogaea]